MIKIYAYFVLFYSMTFFPMNAAKKIHFADYQSHNHFVAQFKNNYLDLLRSDLKNELLKFVHEESDAFQYLLSSIYLSNLQAEQILYRISDEYLFSMSQRKIKKIIACNRSLQAAKERELQGLNPVHRAFIKGDVEQVKLYLEKRIGILGNLRENFLNASSACAITELKRNCLRKATMLIPFHELIEKREKRKKLADALKNPIMGANFFDAKMVVLFWLIGTLMASGCLFFRIPSFDLDQCKKDVFFPCFFADPLYKLCADNRSLNLGPLSCLHKAFELCEQAQKKHHLAEDHAFAPFFFTIKLIFVVYVLLKITGKAIDPCPIMLPCFQIVQNYQTELERIYDTLNLL